ncbi:MAG: cysteine hydrolase family protein [Rhodothermales bacterium]
MLNSAALLIVDVQQGLDAPIHGQRSTPDAEQQMVRLLAAWRTRGSLIAHVQHASTSPDSLLRPDQPGHALKPEVQPLSSEPVFVKNVNSAFIGTDLEAYLHEHRIRAVVVMGMTTDHCVSSTARTASDLGFKTYVVADATAAFERIDHTGRHFTAEMIQAVSLLNLHDEVAQIMTTDEILSALSAHDAGSAM